ncbi:MAG: Uma2 family endonuclease [Bryobacteraceae bacterium]|nr:Uma2 family endonuclease [Bryobacteraceae bacterium]
MATRTLVSVEEYLATDYEPDADYVDGEIEERTMLKKKHSRIQVWLAARWVEHPEVAVYTELRVQISPTRFRVPDILLIERSRDNEEEIVTRSPLLIIEIRSDEDRIHRMMERIEDYFLMGVPHCWILDPYERAAYICSPGSRFQLVREGSLTIDNPRIELRLADAFAALDAR